MPNKVDVSKVAEVLKKHQADPTFLRAVIEELNHLNEGKEEKPPAQKKQSVIVISDPEGRIPKFDFVGWVVQIPEEDSPSTTLDRVFRGAYSFNTTKKGRLAPVSTVGEAIENVSTKLFKEEAGLWIRTKTPVLCVVTDNAIPKDESAARQE